MAEPLPHGLQVIADASDVETALKIALARGGSRLQIPQKAEGSVLAEIVGIDAARKIVKDLANERLTIPLAKKALAFSLAARGWSQEKIAVELKVTRRTIQYWLTGNTPTRQIDMFDDCA
ncbi:helix-turn-helix domain-containing protein [Magnetovibrio sp.]|uniref:helix-turn-helix domain-containing protein n=1 Tax=Magnetovibrio sp. TaxID=2024836 RepID=UPI002F948D24